MILTTQQAKEIGEALIDASEDADSLACDHVVVTVCNDEAAVTMVVDDVLEDFGYEPLFTVKAG